MEQAMMLTENARRIMEMRYLLKDPDTGELQETPEQAVWRVAMNVAAPTAVYAFLEEGQPWGELDDSSFLDHAEWLSNNEDLVRTCERLWRWMDKKGRLVRPTWPVTEEWKLSRVVHRYELRIAEVARKYEAMMRRLEFFPNSPTWTGAGTPLGQLAACVPGHVLVSTSRGYVPMAEVVSRVDRGEVIDVVAFTPPGGEGMSAYRTAEAHDHAEVARVVAGVKNGVKSVIRFIVQGGINLDLTGDHLVWASDASKHGRFRWVRADELGVGHRVMLDNRPSPFSPEACGSLDESVAALLGWLQTDGYVGQPGETSSPIIEFETINDDEFDWVNGHIEALGWEGGSIIEETVQREDITYRRIRFYGKDRSGVFAPYGVFLRREHKVVPPEMFRSPQPVVVAYLRSIFQADAHVSRSGVELVSASKGFLSGIQMLLAALGVTSKVRSSGERRDGRLPGWKLHVMAKPSREAFEREVGFIGGTKRERLAEINQNVGKGKPLMTAVAIEDIQYLGEMEVYDIQTTSGTFFAQRIGVHNCFVLPIADDLVTQRDSIFETLKVAVAIQQTGGGNGFSFSGLRPKGSSVSKSRGQASGPVGFLRTYNAAFGEVQQGGTRRGANMGVMRVSHPDIREFVAAKVVEGEIANFNISVGLTDDFMTAVELDREYLLRFGDKVYDRIRARDLWDELIRSAWELGDPGCLFLDTANRENPCPTRYTLEATNPCVTGDTWVFTKDGPRQVVDLLGVSVEVIVDGKSYQSQTGFFPTKFAEVFEVRTKEGWRVKATADHLVMTDNGWTEVQNLCPGSRVQLHDHRGYGDWDGPGSFGDGYLLGMLWGDGTFCGPVNKRLAVLSTWDADLGSVELRTKAYRFLSEHSHRSDWKGWRPIAERGEWRMSSVALTELAASFGIAHGDKHLSPSIERTSSDFYRGFLQAAFGCDGHIEGSPDKGITVRLSQSHLGDLEAIQRMLARLGIISRIYADKQRVTGFGTSSQYRLVIPSSVADVFREVVGWHSVHEDKWNALRATKPWSRGPYCPSMLATVSEVVSVGEEQTYDIQVSDVHAFDANGLYLHNCGEQFLPPYSNCCLGSLAVHRFVKTTDTGPAFDFDRYRDAVVLATEFLDDVVDANRYVDVVPELEEAAMGERRIGLGIMGLADLLMMLGLPYDSDEGRGFAQYLMEFTRLWAMHTSAKRAKERGCFEWFGDSIYTPDGGWEPKADFLIWSGDFSSEISWPVVQEMIRQDGIRNACQLTIAPTGTISNVTGCEGSGCEPLFALTYVRKVMQEGMNVELSYGSQLFVEALTEAGMTGDEVERIVSEVAANGGSCQGLDSVPEHIQRVFKVAGDISPIDHVKMQAALQVSVDNSISKTINMPNSATPDDVAAVYRLAYDLGCKGITIYRQGSRVLEVLSTAKAEKDEGPVDPVEEERKPHQWAYVSPRSIPDYAVTYGLEAKVFPVATSFGKLHVTVTHLASHPDRPFDVRLQLGKAGNDKLADVEAIGRMISLALRAGVPVDDVVDQLEYIGGATVHGWGEIKVRSVADAVAKLLKRLYVEDMASDYTEGDVRAKPLTASALVEHDTKMTCPNCGQATIVMESGCLHCETRLGGCGIYSACD